MSTIDGYWLSFGTHIAARGRCARFVVILLPSGGAVIGCARNRKSFRHMVTGFEVSETSTNYSGGRNRMSSGNRRHVNTHISGFSLTPVFNASIQWIHYTSKDERTHGGANVPTHAKSHTRTHTHARARQHTHTVLSSL